MLLYKNSRINQVFFPKSQLFLVVFFAIGLFSCKEVAKANEANSKVQVSTESKKSDLPKQADSETKVVEKIEVEEKADLNFSVKRVNAKEGFIRESNESAETFVLRVQKELKNREEPIQFNHPVIETENWLEKINVIIAFFEKQEEEEPDIIEGHLFISKDQQNYQSVLIEEYGPEGNKAQIVSVFFANADKDYEKELVVLCSWEQSIKGMIEGELYRTYIYDNFDSNSIPEKLVYLEESSNYFSLEFDGIQEGETKKAKYKTAQSIKKKLKKIIESSN